MQATEYKDSLELSKPQPTETALEKSVMDRRSGFMSSKVGQEEAKPIPEHRELVMK
jgi:hypothetical protein